MFRWPVNKGLERIYNRAAAPVLARNNPERSRKPIMVAGDPIDIEAGKPPNTEKPAYNGTPRDRTFFSYTDVPFTQVLEVLGPQNPGDLTNFR
jgi:hypothetical protein